MEPRLGMYLTPQVSRQDKPLFCHHVFKFILIKLSKSPLLGDVDLLATRELEHGPAEGLNHMLHVLQLGADGHYDSAHMDTGHCVRIPVWSLGWGQPASHECPLEMLSPRSLGNQYRHQAVYTTKEAAVFSHCTLGLCGGKSAVGLIGCRFKFYFDQRLWFLFM